MLLVSLAIIPLLYPHAAILREHYQFLQEARLHRDVRAVYADIVEQLYLQASPWEAIQHKTVMAIPWEESYPYNGTYSFSIKNKRPKGTPDNFYVEMQISCVPKLAPETKPIVYKYALHINKKP